MGVISTSVQDFTVDFYKTVAGKTEGNNVLCSLCAYLVLSMTASGARGTTARQLLDALHLPDTLSDVLPGFNRFLKSLSHQYYNVITDKEEQLSIANKIYFQKNKEFPVKADFKKKLQTYFWSECDEIDFYNKKEAAKTINDWCMEKTNNKITDLVSEDTFCPYLYMILLSAVYFNASWESQFSKGSTKPLPFHIDEKTIIDVPTMNATVCFYHKELPHLKAQLISIPYKVQGFFMVIIMPNKVDGLKYIEQNFGHIDFRYDKYAGDYDILHLPKFKIESFFDLNDSLKVLGMTTMFETTANFENISDIKPLFVNKVYQKCFIDVNEAGTEAAALSYVRQIGVGCGSVKRKEFHVNKPFFYMIMHNNTPIFVGRVCNPLK